jgi:hypothetical protein
VKKTETKQTKNDTEYMKGEEMIRTVLLGLPVFWLFFLLMMVWNSLVGFRRMGAGERTEPQT